MHAGNPSFLHSTLCQMQSIALVSLASILLRIVLGQMAAAGVPQAHPSSVIHIKFTSSVDFDTHDVTCKSGVMQTFCPILFWVQVGMHAGAMVSDRPGSGRTT